MMQVLWYEAKMTMQNEIDRPEDAFMFPVDIDSTEPGIVTSRAKSEILRRQVPLPRMIYERKQEERKPVLNLRISPIKTVETAMEERAKRQTATQAAMQKLAKDDISKEKRSVQAAQKRAEQREKREQETKEEREERLRIAREKRAQKKQEKQEK